MPLPLGTTGHRRLQKKPGKIVQAGGHHSRPLQVTEQFGIKLPQIRLKKIFIFHYPYNMKMLEECGSLVTDREIVIKGTGIV